MGADAMGLQIPVGFSLEEAQQALRQLEQMARQTGKGVQAELVNSERGMKTATTSLMGFVREQRREAGTARFFVNEVAQIIPVSGAAKGALVQMGGAVVGGGPWAIAIAGASVLVGHLVSKFYEQQKAAREAALATIKAASDMAQEIASLDSATSAFYASFRAFAQAPEEKFIAGATAALRARVDRLSIDIEIKRTQLEALKAAGADEEEIQKAEREVDVLGRLSATLRVKLIDDTALARAAFPLMESERQKAEAVKKSAEEIAAARKKEAEDFRRWQADTVQRLAAFNREQEKLEEQDIARFQAYLIRRDELRKQARGMVSAFGEAGGDLGKAGQLGALYAETQQKLDLIREMESEGVMATADAEALRTAITEEQSRRRTEILLVEHASVLNANRELVTMGRAALAEFGAAALGEFGKVMRSSRAYAQAMKAAGAATGEQADFSAGAIAAWTQNILAGISAQAITKSIFYLAEGYALASNPITASFAPLAFKAAATFAAVGAVAGGAAIGIGQVRPMTEAERSSVAAAEERNQPGEVGYSSSGARELGGASGRDGFRADVGERVVRETVYVIGPAGMTEAELARVTARSLEAAKRLDLVRREG